jgi:hypothetical protein
MLAFGALLPPHRLDIWRSSPLDTMGTMPNRVIVLFLAFVLLWSGLATIEAPRAFAQPSPERQHAIAHAGGLAAADDGSVEHHHLDDLPSQAQNDPPTETPGLLPAPLKAAPHSLALGRPHTFVSAAAGSPFLAGLLRPPCSAALAG